MSNMIVLLEERMPDRKVSLLCEALTKWQRSTRGIHPRGAGDRAVARLVFAVAGVKASASEGVGDGAAEPTLFVVIIIIIIIIIISCY